MVEMKYFMEIGWVSIHKRVKSRFKRTMFSLFDSLSLKKVIFKPNNIITKMSLIYKYETEGIYLKWEYTHNFIFAISLVGSPLSKPLSIFR